MSHTATFPNISRLDGYSMTVLTAHITASTPSSSNGHMNGQSKPLDLLSERAKTHGSFQQTARIAQAIKDVMRSAPNWETASAVRRECWEMIATKLARQLSGDPEHLDHDADIEGYDALAGR